MASNADLVQYISDQCSGAGEIIAKKMFGDYGIYCNGKIFGLICDDKFYLKPTKAGEKMLKEVVRRPPYEGAKDYFLIEDVDDHAYISDIVKATCEELPKPKRKSKRNRRQDKNRFYIPQKTTQYLDNIKDLYIFGLSNLLIYRAYRDR